MTLPVKKKEHATQLAQLEAALASARGVTAKRRAAVKRAEKHLDSALSDEAAAQYGYDSALVASWGDTPDWHTLLDIRGGDSAVMYHLACRELDRMGLETSMLNMETGQRVVWLGFETDGEEELQQKLRGVQFILPFVKAGQDGQREISLRHAQPGKFALSLAVDRKTQAVSVVMRVMGRKKQRSPFPGVEAALRFLQREHAAREPYSPSVPDTCTCEGDAGQCDRCRCLSDIEHGLAPAGEHWFRGCGTYRVGICRISASSVARLKP